MDTYGSLVNMHKGARLYPVRAYRFGLKLENVPPLLTILVCLVTARSGLVRNLFAGYDELT